MIPHPRPEESRRARFSTTHFLLTLQCFLAHELASIRPGKPYAPMLKPTGQRATIAPEASGEGVQNGGILRIQA
jgi:hypothetical protein